VAPAWATVRWEWPGWEATGGEAPGQGVLGLRAQVLVQVVGCVTSTVLLALQTQLWGPLLWLP